MLTYNLESKSTNFFVIVWKWLVSMILAARGKKKLEKLVKSWDQNALESLLYRDYLTFPTFLLLFCQIWKVIIFKKYFRPYK
jgi:hypothetical protein